LKSRALRIYLFAALLAVVLFGNSVVFARDGEHESTSYTGERLLLPFSNPLKGFDPNLMAWHSSTKLLMMGEDWLYEKSGFSGSKKGRFSQLLLSAYFNYATSYYSHEIAHQFLNRSHHTFWVDMTDWFPHWVPEFIFSEGYSGFWNDEELERFIDSQRSDLDITSRLILTYEAGLYQENFNARFAATTSSLKNRTEVNKAMSFMLNRFSDFPYLLFARNETIKEVESVGYIWYDDNDITGYVALMEDLGVQISSDDWMVSSGLAFFASGQTWNAARALYQYFISGDGSVENISFNVSDRLSISPPNFYLFATVRGLYLETECFIHSAGSGKAVRIDIGTGLDSFGLNQTGPVDWLRFGGEYYSFQIGIPYSSLRFSPFCYLNFDRELRH